MNKTPVSILQEMMVKKGTVPNYELIHDGGGSHVNTFVYRVSCDGLIASGTGRCKKDAKHEAAAAMLEVIAAHRSYPQLPATPADSPVRTPLPQQLPPSPKIPPNGTFVNAIGDLKDLCAENELQEPIYNLISDIGPPHARVFTYECLVSTFKEEGRATTKKQAKHEASRKMLDRLLDVVSDLKDKDEHDDDLLISSEIAKMRYTTEFGKLPTKRVNLGVKLSDYHLKLKKTFTNDTIPSKTDVFSMVDSVVNTVRENQETYTEDVVDSIKKKFKELLAPLNIDITSTIAENSSSTDKVLFMKLNTVPEITEIEFGNDVVLMELISTSKVALSLKMLMEDNSS